VDGADALSLGAPTDLSESFPEDVRAFAADVGSLSFEYRMKGVGEGGFHSS
jgi:hypothetical protein